MALKLCNKPCQPVFRQKRFGGITATNNVMLNLRRGARHALIGPNGAG